MPIRIGGDRKPALSLDSKRVGEEIREPSETDSRTRFEVDWRALGRAAKLDNIERAVYAAVLRGVSRYLMPRELGLTPRQAFAAYDSCIAKLRNQREHHTVTETLKHSRSLAYREQIRPGLYSWELARLDESFIEIMDHEKLYFVSNHEYRNGSTKNAFVCPSSTRGKMLSLIELNAKLIEERAKLGRISERCHAANIAVEQQESAVEMIQKHVASEEVQAALEERPVAGERLKELGKAETALRTARANLTANRAALIRQSVLVEGVEQEIADRHAEKLKAALVKPRAEFLKGLADFVTHAQALEAAIVANGGTDLDVLFPPSGEDRFSDFGDRQRLLGLFVEVVRLGQPRHGWEGEAAKQYWQRKAV